MPHLRHIVAIVVFLGASAMSHATIMDFKQANVDFTRPVTATNDALWSTPETLTWSKDGLGWDGESESFREGWIQTKPLALGVSWRTPASISIRVTIQPPPGEVTLNNGQKTNRYGGDVYARYSPDLQHWSSWQVLPHADPQKIQTGSGPLPNFSGTISVPESDRSEYGKLLSEYSALDVPWKSDEEAAVRWILQKQPDFFSKQIPFIGYVEFLYEGSFYGGQRIKSLKAEVFYGMSGLHSIPKATTDKDDRDTGPWRFTAKLDPVPTVAWAEKCLGDFGSIKIGMTREEVARKFKEDGGLQSASPVRFVHPACPFLKVNVEFDFKRNQADQGRAVTGKDDKVIRVSQPYLERPFSD